MILTKTVYFDTLAGHDIENVCKMSTDIEVIPWNLAMNMCKSIQWVSILISKDVIPSWSLDSWRLHKLIHRG